MPARQEVYPARVPVLDRLGDVADRDAAPTHGRVLDLDSLVSSIMLNLERVFGTRSPVTCRQAASVDRTLANYGMPQLRGDPMDRGKVAPEIVDAATRTVAAFEPRILSPRVDAEMDRDDPSILRLTVSGGVRMEHHVRPARFEVAVAVDRRGGPRRR